MSDKVKPQHVQRKAILYIRQSSTFQVQHNQESRRLQYAMKDRLQQLGWREIEIIDDDGTRLFGADASSQFVHRIDVDTGAVTDIVGAAEALVHRPARRRDSSLQHRAGPEAEGKPRSTGSAILAGQVGAPARNPQNRLRERRG